MEKKSTKIAYFVGLAVVVVALIIAKVTNDGSGFVATGWALFPPVVAIALALISKEVYSSLFLGCLVAALLLANFDPWQTVVNFIGAGEGVGMINAIDISILIFLVILGIMVDLMNKAGGSAAFGRWATKAVKTRSGAQLLTMLLGRTKDLPLVRREAAAKLHVRTLNFRGPTDAAELRLTARAMVTQGTPAAIESLLEAELADLFARLAAADCAAISSTPASIKVSLLPQG